MNLGSLVTELSKERILNVLSHKDLQTVITFSQESGEMCVCVCVCVCVFK